MSGWTAYDPSMYHLNTFRQSASNVSGSFLVARRYFMSVRTRTPRSHVLACPCAVCSRVSVRRIVGPFGMRRPRLQTVRRLRPLGDHFSSHAWRNGSKRKGVVDAPTTLFDGPDVALDFRYVFVLTTDVGGSTGRQLVSEALAGLVRRISSCWIKQHWLIICRIHGGSWFPSMLSMVLATSKHSYATEL